MIIGRTRKKEDAMTRNKGGGIISSPNTKVRGKIFFAGPRRYSAFGNCVQKPGLGGFAGEPSSLTLTGAYCDELDLLAHWPHNPATQHINTVTTHWNQVTKRGAGMEIPSFDMRILFRYTIAMLTNQYVPTTLATVVIDPNIAKKA